LNNHNNKQIIGYSFLFPFVQNVWSIVHQETGELDYSPKLECEPMPNVMAALPNIGGALCKSSLIPFLVPRRKDWLTPAARVPCSNGANIGERKTSTPGEFCTRQNSLIGGKSRGKCIYNVSTQKTAKHRAKFG